MGDCREDALIQFLKNGKLPSKYGIGSGEIISPLREVSRQSDLIIYDAGKCPLWIYSQKVQVFPIEGVYGIIEVKSKLSKAKFKEGLVNIEQIKKMVTRDNISRSLPIGTMVYSRPIPFGIIFGYKLGNNSLKSLEKNIIEYQKSTPPALWPNIVVVLEEGIIFQSDNKFRHILNSKDFNESLSPIRIHFKKDTLFEFYSALFSMLSSIHLGDINIRKYVDLPKKVGDHFVKNHDRIPRSIKEKTENKVYALNERFINRIFDYCQKMGKKSYKEILLSEIGQLPVGISEKDLSFECYYYDPENLPGMHEIQQPFQKDEKGRVVATCKMKVPSTYVIIDGETYFFPQAYIEDEDLTEVIGKTLDDL